MECHSVACAAGGLAPMMRGVSRPLRGHRAPVAPTLPMLGRRESAFVLAPTTCTLRRLLVVLGLVLPLVVVVLPLLVVALRLPLLVVALRLPLLVVVLLLPLLLLVVPLVQLLGVVVVVVVLLLLLLAPDMGIQLPLVLVLVLVRLVQLLPLLRQLFLPRPSIPQLPRPLLSLQHVFLTLLFQLLLCLNRLCHPLLVYLHSLLVHELHEGGGGAQTEARGCCFSHQPWSRFQQHTCNIHT